ncbi:MAG TPA: hypothetical protein VFS43_32905 [Polyangiaceae bacterium]|nr:hypothetical protein [Polyangiaceae bacterium]
MASVRRSSERRGPGRRPPARLGLLAALAAAPACGAFDAKGAAPSSGEAPPPAPAEAEPGAPAPGPGLPPAARHAARLEGAAPAAAPRPGLPPGVLSLKPPARSGGAAGRENSVHALAVDATHVFFNDGYGRIWGARKDGAGAPFEVLPGAGPSRPNPAGGLHALTLIADGDDLVFTADSGLWRLRKAGGAPKPVTSGKQDAVMLAADEGYFYFSTFDGSPIRRVPKAGGEAVAVGEGIKSGALAVDGSHLYVAAYGRGTLSRRPKAGGRAAALASGLPKPVGLALDDDAVYVSCEADGSVRRVPKAGGPAKVIARDQINHDELALDRDYVYWASWEEGGPLRRVRKDGSAPPETLLSGLRSPEGVAVDERNVYVANKGFGEVLVVPKAGVDGTVVYPREPP